MSDLLEDDDTTQASLGQMLSIARLGSDIRTYYLLLILLLTISGGAVIAFITLMEPEYTATAIVGPADNSDQPFGDAMGGALGGGIGGIAKHLHVGGMLGQPGMDDTFDEYTSLLTSNRLAEILVRNDRILPEIFSDDWDGAHGRWLPHDDFLHRSADFVKTLLHRPVKPAPDQDDLEKYFEKNLIVDPSLETSFATVTFRFRDPAEAERLLGIILLEADNIIRQDKRHDVLARIAYLNNALEHLSLADQKPELIDILSQQEQEMMMIESDHNYASMLIDSPHAPLKPSSPTPIVDGAVGFAMACLVWLGMVRMTPAQGFWRRFLSAFARPRGARAAGAAHEDPLADALGLPGALDSRPAPSPRSSS
jgi:hypothetical protein